MNHLGKANKIQQGRLHAPSTRNQQEVLAPGMNSELHRVNYNIDETIEKDISLVMSLSQQKKNYAETSKVNKRRKLLNIQES